MFSAASVYTLASTVTSKILLSMAEVEGFNFVVSFLGVVDLLDKVGMMSSVGLVDSVGLFDNEGLWVVWV